MLDAVLQQWQMRYRAAEVEGDGGVVEDDMVGWWTSVIIRLHKLDCVLLLTFSVTFCKNRDQSLVFGVHPTLE